MRTLGQIEQTGKIALSTLTVVLFAFMAIGAHAQGQCTEDFSWLPNSEIDLAGYKIYFGLTDGGPYPNEVEVGNPAPEDGRIHTAVSELNCGQIYYFVCVAVNGNGTESSYSAQLQVTTDGPGPPQDTVFVTPPE